MKKIISFSVWGTNPIYRKGLIENLKLAPIIYPGWTPRVYVNFNDLDSPASYPDLEDLNCEVHMIDERDNPWGGLFWRFEPAGDKTIERFICRDADSRLNVREKAAVDQWITSGKPFHCMRDHKNHDVPILGGMWGCVGGYLPKIQSQIFNWCQTHDAKMKGSDQKFLAEKIWPLVKDDQISHDGFFPTRYGGTPALPFPIHPPFMGKHVGEIIT